MFFKVIDKFFFQIKQVVSFVVMILISLSALTFLYWVLSCANVALPDWLNDFVIYLCNIFTAAHLNPQRAREIQDILPVITSIIIGVISYLANCLLILLERHHKKYQQAVDKYKNFVQKNVNKQLETDFYSELRKSKLMLVKVKVISEQKTSYLTTLTDQKYDTDAISSHIENTILSSISTHGIYQKGKTSDSIYFLINDLDNAKDFFTDVVEFSTKIINENLKPKLDIAFYCGCELLNDSSEILIQEKYISRMFGLKLANKIIVTNKFKVFYENLHKDLFYFAVQGEYNLNDPEDNEIKNTMLYTLQRK